MGRCNECKAKIRTNYNHGMTKNKKVYVKKTKGDGTISFDEKIIKKKAKGVSTVDHLPGCKNAKR